MPECSAISVAQILIKPNYSNLSELMKLKYHSLYDAELKLGETSEVRSLFLGLQEKLYENT